VLLDPEDEDDLLMDITVRDCAATGAAITGLDSTGTVVEGTVVVVVGVVVLMIEVIFLTVEIDSLIGLAWLGSGSIASR
jgi:hypothetical protein